MNLNYIKTLFIIFLFIIIIVNLFNCKKIEGFGNTSTLPNIITSDNFNKYFMVDTGIANCSNQSGCPTNVTDYITEPG